MKNLLTQWKNEDENRKIEFDLLALEDTLKKSYKEDKCLGRKNLLT